MAPPSWTAAPFEGPPPPTITATSDRQQMTQAAGRPQTVVRFVTSTIRAGHTATVTQSSGTIPHQAAQTSDGGLTMTTKALISVLAVLLLCMLVAIIWYYITRKDRQRKESTAQRNLPHIAAHYANAELESSKRRRAATPVAEVNGLRTPGELSVANSIYLGRYAPRFPKELEAAYFRKHQSINSEKRELDAWSLHGWSTPKF